jgi:hypothetical protein
MLGTSLHGRRLISVTEPGTMSTANNGSPDLSSAQAAPNGGEFKFLRPLNSILAEYAERAAKFGDEYPDECLINIRKFVEYVVVYLENPQQTRAAKRPPFLDRLRSLTDGGYLPETIRKEMEYIWRRCNEDGAHAPRTFLLSKAQVRAHKSQQRVVVRPVLVAAGTVARWVQNEFSNESILRRIKWFFLRRPIGLKEQAQKVF